MSQYTMTVSWNRQNAKFTDSRYSRAHTWRFDGGLTVPASSSPHVVPVPYSEIANVDPEEAYVAALASCHMLGFLYIAARCQFTVDAYEDKASGVMEKDKAGRLAITRVTLAPRVTFSGSKTPTDAEVEAMHHEAHESCFIANSVRTVVQTQGTWAMQAS
jgi:organic hydroperoxide reductase OsmC/OhrA